MIIDWHDDLRTRCNLALREYLRVSGLCNPRALILNIHGNDCYLVYDNNKMFYYGDFWIGDFRRDEEYLFEVSLSDHQEWNMRFGRLSYDRLAWCYADFAYEGIEAYCLDDQVIETIYEPNWGRSVIQVELVHAYAEVNTISTNGVICELFDWKEEVKIVNEYSMFIPFDFTHPPARNFVGCQVDGTFFLLFNHVESNSC